MALPNSIDELLARLQEEGRFAVVLWGRWNDKADKAHDVQTSDDCGIDATRNMSDEDVRQCIVGASTLVDPGVGAVVREFLLQRKDKPLTLEEKLDEVMRCLMLMRREAILVSWPLDFPEGNGHGAPLAGMRINTSPGVDDDEAATMLLRLVSVIKPQLRPMIKAALDELR